MYKKFIKHSAYYFSLIAILALGLVLIFLTSPNIKQQGLIIALTVFFYVLWGILHHLINHELTLRIMVEYLLIGVLGLAVIFFMMIGGLI